MITHDEFENKDRAELIQFILVQQQLIQQLYEQLKLLKSNKFDSSAEKFFDPDPAGRLFDEIDPTLNEKEIDQAEKEISFIQSLKKTGRKPLPEHLSRERIDYTVPEVERLCSCGSPLTIIGEVCTEQLDIIPAKVYVKQHVQEKLACQSCHQVIKVAKKPMQPIPKSIAAPGLLANVLTQKFQFHLPLYRQEQMIQALGVNIPRATLSLWVIRCAQLLQPLVNLLQDEIMNYDVAYADETTVQVLKEKDKTAESQSYMWVFGGGVPKHFSVVYQYFPNRTHTIAIDFFSDYKGYLHCDGYQAYDRAAEKNRQLTQVGCWYHVRRKFIEAGKVSKKSGMADWYLKQIQRLAKIEKDIIKYGDDGEKIKEYRSQHAGNILQEIKKQLDLQVTQVPKESLLGKALTYTLNQWPKLQIYLQDNRLEISNNRMERAIKPFAVSRKNWLFCNSVEGAKAAGIIYSLIETCKIHKVNCYEWLYDTLTKIPTCEKPEQFEALLPFNFKK